jgi:hypothetical protein
VGVCDGEAIEERLCRRERRPVRRAVARVHHRLRRRE